MAALVIEHSNPLMGGGGEGGGPPHHVGVVGCHPNSLYRGTLKTSTVTMSHGHTRNGRQTTLKGRERYWRGDINEKMEIKGGTMSHGNIENRKYTKNKLDEKRNQGYVVRCVERYKVAEMKQETMSHEHRYEEDE